jgi:phage terminase large subunit-like protein
LIKIYSSFLNCSSGYFRKKGELLCDKREGNNEINFLKKELGEYAFSAQYQQNPININNGYVKRPWIQRYTKNPNFNFVYQSWDTAIKTGINNDYSVCTSWGITNNTYYLIDIFKKIKLSRFEKYYC